MGLRPTKGDEDAGDRCRGINNLRRVFNGAVGDATGLAAQTNKFR